MTQSRSCKSCEKRYLMRVRTRHARTRYFLIENFKTAVVNNLNLNWFKCFASLVRFRVDGTF